MADDFNVVFSADDRDLINSYLKQTDQIQKMQVELKKWQKEAREAGAASEKAAKDGAAGADKMVGKLTAVAGGWMSVSSAVSTYILANKEAIEESEKHAEILDDLSKKYSIIAGLRGLESKDAQKAILDTAFKTGVTKEQAHEAATQLVSSGMESKEVQNGGLEAFLRTQNAAGLIGKNVDSATLASSMSKYLESQNIAKTAANFRQYGAQIQQLAGPTNLGFSGINQLAGEGASLGKLIKPEEQLAAYANLVGSFNEPDAATGLRNFVGRLGDASERKPAADALKAMKLSPDDVDFSGEDMKTVLNRMAGGLEVAPAKKRDDYLKAIFGDQANAVAATMIQNREAISANMLVQQNLAGFDRDADLAQQGPGAANRRLALEYEVLAAEKAGRHGQTKAAIQTSMMKAGISPFQRYLSAGAYNVGSGLGFNEEDAAHFSIRGPAMFKPSVIFGKKAERFVEQDYKESLARVNNPEAFSKDRQEEARASAEHIAAMERNTAAVVKNNELMGKSQVPVVSRNTPRPIAGAGRPQ